MVDNWRTRFKRAFSVFLQDNRPTYEVAGPSGAVYSRRPYVPMNFGINKNGIIIPIYTRIAIDVAATEIRHVDLDTDNDNRFKQDHIGNLNDCLTLDPNIDQTSSAFWQSLAMRMCEEGVVAVVATRTTEDPDLTDAYEVLELRVGTVKEWFPRHVMVEVYNDETGLYDDVLLSKKVCAIIENPLYAVMNEPNSTLQRLLNKLRLLDVIDEQSGSGKLDIIFQLPYNVRHDSRKEYAEQRLNDIQVQLKDSTYGMAYIDASEKVTQLNRPVENNLMGQIEYLTTMLYGQLGFTPEIFNGTADEAAMINFFNRTIEPFLRAITTSMKRTFLSKTARTQGQSIEFYRDPFKLVPLANFAEIADKLTRNEIASSNDIRTAIGWKPSKDKKADELRNANLSQPKEEEKVTIENESEREEDTS